MTTSPAKLSLRAAIFINLNIMLGAGIFINTVLLAKNMGGFGAIAYLSVGIVLLPLIITFAHLVEAHNGGSFYDYARPLNPFAGFISHWSYFIGKLAACGLGIHVFVSLIQSIFVPLQTASPLILDGLLLALFVFLNTLNVRIGSSIQITFFALKMVPILFVFLSSAVLFSPTHLIAVPLSLNSVFSTIPFALYAFTGFEATCSIVHSIEKPRINGPRAIFISYVLSVIIAILFQTTFYANVGEQLASLTSYLEAFPKLLSMLAPLNDTFITTGTTLLHVGIACSCLGGAYGILFSNAWNLYTLAVKNYVPFSRAISTLNTHAIPSVCIIVEGLIVAAYLWYTQGDQVALQQISTTALTITFTLSVIGYCVLMIQKDKSAHIGFAALISCSLLIGSLVRNVLTFGVASVVLFLLILLIGAIFFRHYYTQSISGASMSSEKSNIK